MPLFLVDAFTAKPFTGNQAAVCLLDAPASTVWMQRFAAEMNLSETAFLTPGDDAYGLRWFTPDSEVDLCGHATLASAHVLFETGAVTGEARFDTRSGRLTVCPVEGGYEMDFPATPPEEFPAPVGLAELVGATPVWTGRSQYDLFVELADEATVRGVSPDAAVLKLLDVRGVLVTSRADKKKPYDIVSRFFAPQLGINEDPVTGSAHCAVGPYWAAKLGKDTLRCHQASSRTGNLGVRVAGDRVMLTGNAVTIMQGEVSAAAAPR